MLKLSSVHLSHNFALSHIKTYSIWNDVLTKVMHSHMMFHCFAAIFFQMTQHFFWQGPMRQDLCYANTVIRLKLNRGLWFFT